MSDEGIALEPSTTVEIPDTRLAELLNAARIVCDTWFEQGPQQVTVPQDKQGRMGIAILYLAQKIGRASK
jgi:hypothetical protein